jgi:HSP20 family molecular chaperone IbpA
MATMSPTMTPTAPRREAAERGVRTVAPRVDIYETDTAYVLLADMPGVATDGLDIETERDTLVIRGRVVRPEKLPDYQEFELADYHRAFTLTEDLDTARITAALRDGVLRVEIPKSERTRPKKIPVRAE